MKVEERSFTSIKDIYDFVAEMQKIIGEVWIEQGPYRVRGKSIMGIFSLDLVSPVKVLIWEEE